MSNWLEVARQNRRVASFLISEGEDCPRSAISRAYYAAYSKITHELFLEGVTMPKDREGPAHAKLRPLIETNFRRFSPEKRQALSSMVGRLYAMRVVADYFPSERVDIKESREAANIMKKIFEVF